MSHCRLGNHLHYGNRHCCENRSLTLRNLRDYGNFHRYRNRCHCANRSLTLQNLPNANPQQNWNEKLRRKKNAEYC